MVRMNDVATSQLDVTIDYGLYKGTGQQPLFQAGELV
jgi:hypothetical protein